MEYSARSNLKRVSLELGGKSPQIVFADCPDLDAAAEAAAWGVFYNQGEVCTAASRLLVEASIKDAFLEKVIAVARTMVPGDPLDPETSFGAMVSERQMNTALDYIATADSQGARRLLGGSRVRKETGGFYVEPTIFDRLEPDHTLAREEVFGPVLGVQTFKDPGRGDPPGQRHRLRPGRRPVDVGHQPRPDLGPPAEGGAGLDQRLGRLRHHHAVRGLQAVGLRPRPQPSRVAQVRRPEVGVRDAEVTPQ
jgi:hypothetical protein